MNSYKRRDISVSSKLYLHAIKNRVVFSQRTKQTSPSPWNFRPPWSYWCKYRATVVRIFSYFMLTYYSTLAIGADQRIEQLVTKIARILPQNKKEILGTCHLQEFPEQLIMCFTPKVHDANELHSLGEFKIEQIQNFILVPDLTINEKVL